MTPSVDPQSRGQTLPRKRHRQNPVSCRFCREKKLKCDRQSPCSSCSSRGVSCSNKSQSQTQNECALPKFSDNTVVLERLRYLEAIVLNQPARSTPGGNPPTDAAEASASPWQFPSTLIPSHVQDAPGRGEDTDIHETPASEYPEAVQTLEGTGLRRDPWLRTDAINTEVRVATVQYIVLLASDPALQDLHHLENLQHVLYIPSVQEHLDTCYNDMARGRPANISVLLLLLSILASAAILMSHHSGDKPAPFSPSRVSAYWAGFALDIMKDHHQRPCDMLEDVQATILLASLLLNVEGFSTRMYSLGSVLVSRARDISLHKIDAAGSSAPRDMIETEIKRRVWWYVVTVDWLLSMSGGPHEGTDLVQPRQMAVDTPRNVDDKDLIYTNPRTNRPLSEPTAMAYDIQRLKPADLCRAVVDLMPVSLGDISMVDYQQVIALDQCFDNFLQELPEFLRNDEQSIQQSEQVVARYPQMRIQRQLLSMVVRTKRCKMHQPFLIRGSVGARYSYSRTMSLKSARTVLEERRRTNLFDRNGRPTDRCKLSVNTIYYTFIATIVLVMDLCFNKRSSSEEGDGNNIDNDDNETRVTKTEVVEACQSLHQDRSASGRGIAYLASLMGVLRKYKVRFHPPGPGYLNQNNTTIPNQPPSLHTRLPSYTFANPPPNLTQETSIPITATPPLQRPVTTSSRNKNNFGTAHIDSSSSLDVNIEAYANDLPSSEHGTAAPANRQGSFADFDDIWNDYVKLGPNLDMPLWDSLFSDLQLGIA